MDKEAPDCMYECRVARIESDITTFWMLSRMCWVGTKLYNTAMWYARDQWDKTGKIPGQRALQKKMYESWYHESLPAHTYQHPAHQVSKAFKSWFVLRKKDPTAHPPGFRKKEKLSSIMFTTYGFKALSQNKIRLTLGDQMRAHLQYPDKFLELNISWNTPFPAQGEIQQIEVVPRNGWFDLHAKIALPIPTYKTEGQVGAIDLGMRNPLAATFEDKQEHMFKGGEILAELHYLNKTKAALQKQIMKRTKGKKKHSPALDEFSRRLNAQKDHAIHAMTNQMVDVCVAADANIVVVGDLEGIKKEPDGSGKNWNDKASQNWQQFPVRKVVAQLRYKLARHGILLVEQDERGTSKGRCSSCGCTDRRKIHRRKRGMFVCRNCGAQLNADINGARNQLARYLHREVPIEIGTSAGSSGCLAQPSVWRWNDHRWAVVS